MPNTLTNLIPDAYAALDVVSRELVGFIPAVTLDATASRAARGQTVRSFVAPVAAATDITPAVTPPNDGDQTIGNRSVTITKARRVPFRWDGEESRGINNGGPGVLSIQQQQIAQAIRTLTNEMEADIGLVAARNASRAFGTPGTTPFGSNLNELNQGRQILVDNGAPTSDLQAVINTTAGTNMRNLSNLQRVNESGDVTLLRQGILQNLSGFAIRESAGVATLASGTGALATTNAAGYAVGARVITLAAAGTGTILAGDVIGFAGDPNRYVVVSGDASVADAGTITLAEPGLRRAIPAAATGITVLGASARNVCFARSALVLAARQPALPEQGDSAADRTTIVDERSGFAFEIAMYLQYRQVQWEISAAWGVASMKDEHIALMLG